jgi:hypothetical protein
MSLQRLWLALVLPATACAIQPLPEPQASFDNVRALRGSGLDAMKVGDFAMAKGVVVKFANLSPPGGSFSQYLADTLAAELRGSGRFDPEATLEVSGQLAESHVDSLAPVAHAKLGADFILTRDGEVVFKKRLVVASAWSTDIHPVAAVPEAVNHYTALYAKLIGALFADPDFRKAARAAPSASPRADLRSGPQGLSPGP